MTSNVSFPSPDEQNPTGSPELENLLKNLEWVSDHLRSLGRNVALLTALSIASLFGLGILQVFSLDRFGLVLLVILNLCCAAVAALFLVWFDSSRRRGDILFKEISDEVQWHIRYGGSDRTLEEAKIGPQSASQERPGLRVRVILRSYTASTVLPLMSSEKGPASYLILNLTTAMLSLLLFRLLSLK